MEDVAQDAAKEDAPKEEMDVAGEGLISAAMLAGGFPAPKPLGFLDWLVFTIGDDINTIPKLHNLNYDVICTFFSTKKIFNNLIKKIKINYTSYKV